MLTALLVIYHGTDGELDDHDIVVVGNVDTCLRNFDLHARNELTEYGRIADAVIEKDLVALRTTLFEKKVCYVADYEMSYKLITCRVQQRKGMR